MGEFGHFFCQILVLRRFQIGLTQRAQYLVHEPIHFQYLHFFGPQVDAQRIPVVLVKQCNSNGFTVFQSAVVAVAGAPFYFCRHLFGIQAYPDRDIARFYYLVVLHDVFKKILRKLRRKTNGKRLKRLLLL